MGNSSPLSLLRMDPSDDPEATVTHPSLYDSFLKLSIDFKFFKWYLFAFFLFASLFNNPSKNCDLSLIWRWI